MTALLQTNLGLLLIVVVILASFVLILTVIGLLMKRAGASLKPLWWFAGFIALIIALSSSAIQSTLSCKGPCRRPTSARKRASRPQRLGARQIHLQWDLITAIHKNFSATGAQERSSSTAGRLRVAYSIPQRIQNFLFYRHRRLY